MQQGSGVLTSATTGQRKLMEENASFNSCNALSFHGLSSIPCSGVSTCQMLLPLCFFTSTLFNGCASSKTSSSVCAPSLQGLRLVLLCNKPAPSSSLSRIFSTVVDLSAFRPTTTKQKLSRGPGLLRRSVQQKMRGSKGGGLGFRV